MLRRYVIVSISDQHAAVEMLERTRSLAPHSATEPLPRGETETPRVQ